MHIENQGIVISEIFTVDEGETIKIDMEGTVEILLIERDGGTAVMRYALAGFRELLSAMTVADRELTKIETGGRRA